MKRLTLMFVLSALSGPVGTSDLFAQSQPNPIVFYPHEADLWSVALSRDGSKAMSAGADFLIRIWDTRTGEMLGEQPSYGARSVEFSRDGTRILSAGGDSVRITDAVTGSVIFGVYVPRVVSPGTSGFYFASFNHDESLIVATRGDTIPSTVWSVSTGEKILELRGHLGVVFAAAFSPDGKYIATGSADNTARLWNAATGEQLLVLAGRGRFSNVEFSPDGSKLMTSAFDSIYILDVETRKILQSWKGIEGDIGLIQGAHYISDGRQIVAGSNGGIRFWDAGSGQLLKVLGEGYGYLSWPSLSDDGKRLVNSYSFGRGKLMIWDLTSLSVHDAAAEEDPLQDVNAFPNPATGTFDFRFGISRRSRVELTLVDALGRPVIAQAARAYEPGEHRWSVDVSNLPSGNYFCRVRSGDGVRGISVRVVK